MAFKPELILRFGLVFVFLYAGIAGLVNPDSWIGFVPDIVEIFISRDLFLTIFSIAEILLGLWLIFGKQKFYPSLVSSVFLAAITLPNLGSLEIIFRDIGLFFAAIALTMINSKIR